jgi:hypothetical protein
MPLAEAHPYDPRALLRAGEALASSGRTGAAIALLERVVWLADLDPPSASAAVDRLRALSAPWRERRVVRVHAFADEFVREQEAWQFGLRILWAAVSQSLSRILDTRFVLVSISPFSSAGISNDLEPIHAAVRRSAPPHLRRGIIAGFTGRTTRFIRGRRLKGIATLLDRWLTVRIEPGALPTRVLAHEILHLYGAIHVTERVKSLMNPEGKALTLDPLNYRIVQSTRGRTFGDRGFERHVLRHIDLHETIEAYLAALRLNLSFRSLGLSELLDERRLLPTGVARRARRERLMDPHLADVSISVAKMLLLENRRVEAVVMLEAAAELYGIHTRRGSDAFEQAERLRAVLVRELDRP